MSWIAVSRSGSMSSSKLPSNRTLDSVHSCQLCPLIKLEVGAEFSTVTLPFIQVFLSARYGCLFLEERLKRIVPPSSWMYQNNARPLVDLVLFHSKIYHEISLKIRAYLIDGGDCIIDCDWELLDSPWDDCVEDRLLTCTERGTDSLTTHYIRTRPPNQYPLSPDNIRWMGRCLQRCFTNHATCNMLRQKLHSHKLPKYVLDLGSSEDGQVCLIETHGRNSDYVILSYCWGENPTKLEASKTTSKNIQNRLATGFSLSSLPKTITDAVKVTRELGFRYLWVDALCIQQDRDFCLIRRDLGPMFEFYARAAVVISAASAAHSNFGFSEPRDPLYCEYQLPLTLKDGENTVEDRISLIERAFGEKREPIDARAWTQQEDRNALCFFRFESERVLWRCRDTSLADSNIGLLSTSYKAFSTSSFDGSMFASMLPPTQGDIPKLHWTNWLQEVIDYSARHAKSLDDKLAAFERTAKHMAVAMGYDSSHYKAGLWMEDMPRQLLWCRDYHCKNNSVPVILTGTTLTPLWSWASTQSPITWRDMNDLDWNDHTLQVAECKVMLASPSHPFKNVKRGQLARRSGMDEKSSRVRRMARLIEPAVRLQSWVLGTELGRRLKSTKHIYYCQRLMAEPIVVPVEVIWDTPVQPMPQRVKCLEIRSGVKAAGCSYGIVLSNNRNKMCKRLGYFEFRHRTQNVLGKSRLEVDTDWLHQKRRRKIRII